MELHGPGRTGFYTKPARHATIVIESHPPRCRVEDKSMSRAYADAGTALRAFHIVAQNAMAQGFYLDTG